jgi:general secretion pathway protein G
MDDDIQAEKPEQPEEHITANKPSPSADLPGNLLNSSDDLARLNARRRWVIRIILSTVTGVIVGATAYLCAWYEYRNFIYFVSEQRNTRDTLVRLQCEIDSHQQVFGHLPKTLSELECVQNESMRVDPAGQPVDGWGRPIQYQVKGDSYTLFSYGMDGQPGGQGLDADLYAGKVDKENESPTLWQFATILDSGGMREGCALAAAFAFAVCLIASHGWQSNRSLVVILIANAVTAIFAILTAVVISALHLPSGH